MEDVFWGGITFAICESAARVVDYMLAKGFYDSVTYRKIHHILVLTPMIFWPLFRGRVVVSCVPLLCSAMDLHRRNFNMHQLVQDSGGKFASCAGLAIAWGGWLFFGIFTTVFFWTTPIGISTLSNFYVGDGVACIAGRQFGRRWKLPYNKNKSFAGTIAMAVFSFLASILFTIYFSRMGMVESDMNSKMICGYLVVSIASALVESHPWSSILEDNITVPLASICVGYFVF